MFWSREPVPNTPPLESRQRLGDWGEDFAIKILQQNGYRIIDRNWRRREGELDIVCFKDKSLVFVEVKTRKRISSYHPLNESVSDEKEKRLYVLAALYRRSNALTLRRLRYKFCRFDLFVIAKEHRLAPFYRHYEGAFGAHW